MNQRTSHLRFLSRTRRRWFALRVVEYCGVCAFAGSVVGLLLVPVLIWRGQDALSPALVLLGIGAVAGVVLGWMRRPTILQTAMEADRQLGLHDLLGTVLAKQTFGDPTFEAIVLSRAEQVCTRLSPNDLVLRRLGGRAWGGIGITSAMLLTVAMMSARPRSSEASGERFGLDQPSGMPSPVDVAPNRGADEHVSAGLHRQAPGGRPDDAKDGEGSSDRSASRNGASQRAGKNALSSADGAGTAAGRSADAIVPDLKRPPSEISLQPDGIGKTSAGTADAAQGLRHVLPWQGQQWEADRQQAMRDLDSGKIPDAYRDLVREYFQPEKSSTSR